MAGGPPCQPFSLSGKHKAFNDDRDMFPQAIRAVRESKPESFIFENVKGLLRKNFSSYFGYIVLQLAYPNITRPVSRRDFVTLPGRPIPKSDSILSETLVCLPRHVRSRYGNCVLRCTTHSVSLLHHDLTLG